MNSLKTILQEMVTVYEQLLSVGEEKQEALIKGNHEQLLTIFPKEAALLKEISSLEEQRQAETISYQSLSLSEIIANSASADGKEELQAYQRELQTKLAELEKQHGLNQQLIETSLLYVNSMLNVFTQKQDISNTYTGGPYAPGKEKTVSRSFFDALV